MYLYYIRFYFILLCLKYFINFNTYFFIYIILIYLYYIHIIFISYYILIIFLYDVYLFFFFGQIYDVYRYHIYKKFHIWPKTKNQRRPCLATNKYFSFTPVPRLLYKRRLTYFYIYLFKIIKNSL